MVLGVGGRDGEGWYADARIHSMFPQKKAVVAISDLLKSQYAMRKNVLERCKEFPSEFAKR